MVVSSGRGSDFSDGLNFVGSVKSEGYVFEEVNYKKVELKIIGKGTNWER